MNTLQIDFVVGAAVGLLYMLYVLVRVLSMRDTSRLLKLLIIVPVLIIPIGGALLIHIVLCAYWPEPRDDRFLGILGLAVALVALLAYGSTFSRFAVHDDYTFCFIQLGGAAFLVFCAFFVKVRNAAMKDGTAGLLSMFPKWAVLVAGLTVANVVVHIGLWSEFAEDGVPREKSGSYYLSFEAGDRPVSGRDITKEEYYAFSGHLVRATSSLFLAFVLVPAFSFLLRKPD
jgi:hypothetical protein